MIAPDSLSNQEKSIKLHY